MSIKTVALDIGVYQKLARIKGERESFSKAIERLVDRHLTAHTGSDIASALANAPAPLSAQEADENAARRRGCQAVGKMAPS